MMEEQQTINKKDYDDLREQEEDLVYDDSGEMTPRGRTIVRTENGTYYQYEMLDVDGYNNGDVAPRGEFQYIASDDDEDKIEHIDLEMCSECGFKGELAAYGWRHADDNLCRNCVNLPGMEKYEC